MSQVLKDKIIQHIEKQGALTVSEYMDFCLWDLDYGYYSARDQFSQCQDFVTSPEISSLFGMTLGRWIITQKSIHKAPIIIVELGGGSGHLAVDILDTLLPNYCDSIKEYAIIEKSPKLRGHQKKHYKIIVK